MQPALRRISADDLARELRVFRAEDLAQPRHVAFAPLGQVIICAGQPQHTSLTRPPCEGGNAQATAR